MTFGTSPPRVSGAVPGPRSRALGERLGRVESRNVTRIDEHGPIFWVDAAGANVRDADDNIYVDLTAGFGVSAAGHRDARVEQAIRDQAGRLLHALGDVHPAAIKVELLERLADLAPGDLEVSILSANGSDAVESALKTAVLVTGRPGVVAFEGGYHGLGLGALGVTSGARFRAPFERQLYQGVRFAPFPSADRPEGPDTDEALAAVHAHVDAAAGGPDAIGAVVVEPLQGRGGIIVPPADFLPRLRALCDAAGLLLIVDEVYTGFGRTGRWFACEHTGVVPDLLVIGKSLAGGLPLSAVVGPRRVMEAWPLSEGEAIHTSTFLGNPLACAAALAHLAAIEEDRLVERAARAGEGVRSRVEDWRRRQVGGVAGGRGLGLMQAVVLRGPDAERRAASVAAEALRGGVIVLSEGPALAVTPPLSITDRQLDSALDVLEGALAAVGP